ncbi:hypothetical protein GQ457_15G011380 [Hibiscus cannabinus]
MYPSYQYPKASTNTSYIFPSQEIPVAKSSTDTQAEYRYPRVSTNTRRSSTDTLCFKCVTASFLLQVNTDTLKSSTNTHCTRKAPTARKCLQRLQTTPNGHQWLDTQLGP